MTGQSDVELQCQGLAGASAPCPPCSTAKVRPASEAGDRKDRTSVAADVRPGHAREPDNVLHNKITMLCIGEDVPTLNAVINSSLEIPWMKLYRYLSNRL